jgi:hypothetical protein
VTLLPSELLLERPEVGDERVDLLPVRSLLKLRDLSFSTPSRMAFFSSSSFFAWKRARGVAQTSIEAGDGRRETCVIHERLRGARKARRRADDFVPGYFLNVRM